MKMGIFNRFLGSEEKKSIVPAGFDPSLGISAEPRVWDAVISLGGTCQVAHQIKRSGRDLHPILSTGFSVQNLSM